MQFFCSDIKYIRNNNKQHNRYLYIIKTIIIIICEGGFALSKADERGERLSRLHPSKPDSLPPAGRNARGVIVSALRGLDRRCLYE